MLLNDSQISKLAMDNEMISPFVSKNVKIANQLSYDAFTGDMVQSLKKTKKISFGLSSFGYDLRLTDELLIFSNVHNKVIDPKEFDPKAFVKVKPEAGTDYIIIPPNSFALATTLEYVKMPQDLAGILLTKSTYARCGLICHTTVIDPGFEGNITLELSNTTPLPMKVYVHEGVTQMMFFQGERPLTTYSDKNGKYQGQTGITLPSV